MLLEGTTYSFIYGDIATHLFMLMTHPFIYCDDWGMVYDIVQKHEYINIWQIYFDIIPCDYIYEI